MESKENNRFGFNKVALDELLKKANLTDFLQRKKEGPIRDKKVQKAVDSGVLHPEDAPAPYETIEHEDPLARQGAPNTL